MWSMPCKVKRQLSFGIWGGVEGAARLGTRENHSSRHHNHRPVFFFGWVRQYISFFIGFLPQDLKRVGTKGIYKEMKGNRTSGTCD